METHTVLAGIEEQEEGIKEKEEKEEKKDDNDGEEKKERKKIKKKMTMTMVKNLKNRKIWHVKNNKDLFVLHRMRSQSCTYSSVQSRAKPN